MRRARRPLAALLVTLLASQFLLGMVSNLYARIPARVPGTRGSFDNRLGAAARWALLNGPSEIQAHVAVGLVVGACAITLAGFSLRIRERPWLPLAPLGLLATAGAGIAGAAFIAYGQDNLYSLLMSVAFLAACLSYGALLYLSRPSANEGGAPRPDARPLMIEEGRS
jgi:hypothetical protein